MSRTYKDSNRVKLKRYYRDRWETEHDKFTYEGWKYAWPDFNTARGTTTRTIFLAKAGVKTKKRKEVDTTDHWMSTPSWWTRLMMNRPQRRQVKLWERKALISDLEDLIQPGKKYKHVYFW